MKLRSLIAKTKSKHILWLVFISVTWLNFNQERWLHKEVISNDVNQYYSYLPAFFYENDLSLSFLKDSLNVGLETRHYAPNATPEGHPVIKMSMGMALGYLPFFALAHAYATFFHYDVNGFSVPYHFAIQFSSLFYFLFGLYFLTKLLRYYFDEKIIALTLFLLSFGTNVFYYLSVRAGNVHTFDFFLVSAFLYTVVKWLLHQKTHMAVIGGTLLGLLTLTRPINLLFIVVVVLYDVKTPAQLWAKLKLCYGQKLQLILALVCFLIVVLPQLLYWQCVSGHFLFNSYVNEHFFFNHPHVLKGLFSFRNGWLIYTPIMVISLEGLFWLRKYAPAFLFVLPVFVGIYIYVIFSWWCWWYGGSFGQRALIDLYPILAIPFSAALSEIRSYSKTPRTVAYSILTTLVLLNLFQTMQAKYNIIHYDSMTRANYFRVFLTTSGKSDREKYLQHPNYARAQKGEDDN
ncbi:MAG: hypothetical protein PSX36_13630 [bacterium]|nr:hypothetical protein [bacterium]